MSLEKGILKLVIILHFCPVPVPLQLIDLVIETKEVNAKPLLVFIPLRLKLVKAYNSKLY